MALAEKSPSRDMNLTLVTHLYLDCKDFSHITLSSYWQFAPGTRPLMTGGERNTPTETSPIGMLPNDRL
jgi:hypothetical protein